MPLFENKNRTRIQPLRPGEGRFEFYDQVDGPNHDQLRSLINLWIGELHASEISGFITRMQSGEFDTALPELIVHATLKRLGYAVTLHPEIQGTSKRPDFLACANDGTPSFYVEVTTINHSNDQVAHDNREALIINALDRSNLPARCWLSYNLIRAGSESPRVGPLVAQVEQWARTAFDPNVTDDFVTEQFTTGNWVIEVSLLVGSEPRDGSHSIGGRMLGGGLLTPAEDLRVTLKAKANRYGRQFEIPFILAVADSTWAFSWGQDYLKRVLFDTFLGDEVFQVTLLSDGNYRESNARRGNGFWRGREAPHSQHISGVLLLPDAGLWKMRDEKWQPILALNPWASRPLPEEAIPLSRLTPRESVWRFIEGQHLADLLEIPNPWPE